MVAAPAPDHAMPAAAPGLMADIFLSNTATTGRSIAKPSSSPATG